MIDKLFTNQTINGYSTEFSAEQYEWKFIVEGVLGGAVLKLQIKPTGSSTWSYTGDELNDVSLSGTLERIISASLRWELTSASGTTNVTLNAIH